MRTETGADACETAARHLRDSTESARLENARFDRMYNVDIFRIKFVAADASRTAPKRLKMGVKRLRDSAGFGAPGATRALLALPPLDRPLA